MTNTANNFEDFWEASKLDRFNMPNFSSRVNFYEPDKNLYRLDYPLAAEKLALQKSKLSKIAKKRRSTRAFTNTPLTRKELSQVLASFYATNGDVSRAYPSAGASYALEVFAVCYNVQGIDTGTVMHYDAISHGIVPVTKAEEWASVANKVNVEIENNPQVLLLVTFIPNRLTDKYGERGYRFALLEAGAAMQQVALTVAEHDLKGVVSGGMFDDYWIRSLGLTKLQAKLAYGYLIGK